VFVTLKLTFDRSKKTVSVNSLFLQPARGDIAVSAEDSCFKGGEKQCCLLFGLLCRLRQTELQDGSGEEGHGFAHIPVTSGDKDLRVSLPFWQVKIEFS